MKELNTITIEVLADEQGKLLNPIKFEEQEILELGVYICGNSRFWIVKKLSDGRPNYAEREFIKLCKLWEEQEHYHNDSKDKRSK